MPQLYAGPSLTIYNDNYAVVKDVVTIDLDKGVNEVSVNDVTGFLEPDSVILRDSSNQAQLKILEQSYRNDPVSKQLLLKYFEGQVIDFYDATNKVTVQGKVIRGGSNIHAYGSNPESPIIEVDGKLRFSLPGEPLFPALKDSNILKPQIDWQLHSDVMAKVDAQLSYISSGFSWFASYNFVENDNGLLDISAWITMSNHSGKNFEDTAFKLVAGEVQKPQHNRPRAMAEMKRKASYASGLADAAVTEKSFDEFHLYTLPRKMDLFDKETKQVEFLKAQGVKNEKLYVFDATASSRSQYRSGYRYDNADYRRDSKGKVEIYREFMNSKENQLGVALPKGIVRFYKRDGSDLEFIGGNSVDHTPKNEKVKVYVGNAFDLVGERKQTNYILERNMNQATESFEIILKNRKEEAVTIRVQEELYRWVNWEITQASHPWKKIDSRNIKFEIPIEADREVKLTYTVKYNWR